MFFFDATRSPFSLRLGMGNRRYGYVGFDGISGLCAVLSAFVLTVQIRWALGPFYLFPSLQQNGC